MVSIKLQPQVAKRLAQFLGVQGAANRTDHWIRYGKLNQVRVEGDHAIVSAGAGFDSEYELAFRRPTLREHAARAWQRLRGRYDLNRNRDAYRALWSEAPPAAHSPHQIIATNYLRHLPLEKVTHYLEIGAGTGYLAALVHRACGARITIVDLPEILPLGFLYLTSLFPDASFRLPNENEPATLTFLTHAEPVTSDSVDLAVNTASLGEMRAAQIKYYFRHLRRVLKPDGLFFTVNREEKWMDGKPNRFANYPWSAHDTDLIYEASPLHSITQPQNRMLLRLCRLAKQV